MTYRYTESPGGTWTTLPKSSSCMTCRRCLNSSPSLALSLFSLSLSCTNMRVCVFACACACVHVCVCVCVCALICMNMHTGIQHVR